MSFRSIATVKYLLIFSILVVSGRLRHDIDSKRPKIFKIVEKNDQVFLKKEEPRTYDQEALINFLKDNADLELRVNNILKKDAHLKGRQKKLTKKTVEHGAETSDLQYDPIKNAYFKPLVRVHKTKKYDVYEEGDRVDIKFREKLPKKVYRPRIFRTKPRRVKKTSAAQHAVMHLSLIDVDIKKIRMPDEKEEFYTKLNQIINAIESLHKGVLTSLRTDQLRGGSAPWITKETSVESSEIRKINVTIMPGHAVSITDNITALEYPCAVYPDNPIWNYWTYVHTIHEDECPGDQVKIGDVCSWTPPHKKH